MRSPPRCVESRAVKTLRSHLETRYAEIGRVAKPIWFATWLAFIALMGTSLRWWVFGIAGAVLASYFVMIARIKCPRCGKRLGVGAQAQPGGRARRGLPLRDIRCPHCGLTLDWPVGM